MSVRKLTDAAASALPFQGAGGGSSKNYIVWDADLAGFGMRVGAETKIWLVAYRNGARQQKKLKLGTYPGVKAEAARKAARIALGEVAAGKDPAAIRAEERRRAVAVLADALKRYLAERQARKVVAAQQEDNAMRAGFGPKWLGSDVASLDRQELVKLMDKIRDGRGEGSAEYFRKSARTFLDWCVTAGLIVGNPLAGYRKPRQTKAERVTIKRRGRALPFAELAKVWAACPLNDVFGRLVRFIMLTGCRRTEAAAVSWEWVDRDKGLITIPMDVTKMGRDHILLITPQLGELLDKCPKVAKTKLLFPSDRTKGQISGWSKMLPDIIKRAGAKFTLHDLRRSLKTHVRELGFDSDLASLLIGHARDSFEARYDHSVLLAMRKKAAEAYAAQIVAAAKPELIVAVDNIRKVPA